MITKTVEIVRRNDPQFKSRFVSKVRFEKTSYKLFGFIPVFVKYLQMEHH